MSQCVQPHLDFARVTVNDYLGTVRSPSIQQRKYRVKDRITQTGMPQGHSGSGRYSPVQEVGAY